MGRRTEVEKTGERSIASRIAFGGADRRAHAERISDRRTGRIYARVSRVQWGALPPPPHLLRGDHRMSHIPGASANPEIGCLQSAPAPATVCACRNRLQAR